MVKYKSLIKYSCDATRGANLPKSIPMTGPLIFLSSSEYLTNEELKGLRRRLADRVADEVALGSYRCND